MVGNMKNTSDEPGLLSKALKALSVPIGAVSGYIVTRINIRHSAYENAKNHNMFKDITGSGTKREQAMHVIGEAVIGAEKTGKQFEVLAQSIPLHADYQKAFTKRMETAKLGTFLKQWKFTSSFQQQNAVINGLTVAGVAIGAIYAIASSKMIQHAFSNRDAEKASGQEPSI
jgi:hypothetical protein